MIFNSITPQLIKAYDESQKLVKSNITCLDKQDKMDLIEESDSQSDDRDKYISMDISSDHG